MRSKLQLKILLLLLMVFLSTMLMPIIMATESLEENETSQKVVSTELNYLMVSNKKYHLPSQYKPNYLKVPDVDTFGNYYVLEKKTAQALEEMFKDAKEEGINIALVSAYRDENTQRFLFNQLAYQIGEEEASKAIAYPGTSEHQTGLAADLSTSALGINVSKTFETTQAFEWLQENCWKYGFILRYPEGKEAITTYKYEPWHYRYIGNVYLAKYLMNNQITLEEFYINLGLYDDLDTIDEEACSIVLKKIYWGMKIEEYLIEDAQ